MLWPPVRWRWLNRWYAKALAYFWLPCPICGEPFGGHEHLPGHSFWFKSNLGLNLRSNKGYMVCYKTSCYQQARRITEEDA